MRNGLYTIHENLILEVKSNYADDCLLWIERKGCELKWFDKIKFEEGWYKRIEWEEIKEAFEVKTLGIYRGHKFQLFQSGLDSNNIIIGTREVKAFENLNLLETGDLWFSTDFELSEIESIREERTQALNYLPILRNLPMPKHIEIYFVIK